MACRQVSSRARDAVGFEAAYRAPPVSGSNVHACARMRGGVGRRYVAGCRLDVARACGGMLRRSRERHVGFPVRTIGCMAIGLPNPAARLRQAARTWPGRAEPSRAERPPLPLNSS
ncbi:hypothetical protein AQ932_00910 [Burkholderia pseudomallei]|nr:hypothetical protein AQ931_06760 [Burkholderia pseudomallei]OND51783.1 hypothetical protein AQ932_00910 [Burkholderia pseudomallei]